MNLLQKPSADRLEKTGINQKISISGYSNKIFDIYKIPLDSLYYNDQNGRINTIYKQYQSTNDKQLIPSTDDLEYNNLFEQFIYDSNKAALDKTQQSIKDKGQEIPGVVLLDGRVIDGNRRFTALRRIQKETGISQSFEAIILNLDPNLSLDNKKIKELELDIQLGREERLNYDPVDRIFDVYNTINIQKILTIDEYKKASGVGNTKGIKRDIRLAELIIKFIQIISPGGDATDKFYLARELKVDGPIEEIESTLSKLKSGKEETTEAVLTTLAVIKASSKSSGNEPTRKIREIKRNILSNPDVKKHYLETVEDKVDDIMDAFSGNPISKSGDLKKVLISEEVRKSADGLLQSTNRLSHKGSKDSKRRKVLSSLEDIRDDLNEIDANDFKMLKPDEFHESKEVLNEISDIIFKLKNRK